jgi:hypothetical protein
MQIDRLKREDISDNSFIQRYMMLMHMDINIKSDMASTMDRKVVVEHLKEKEGVKE